MRDSRHDIRATIGNMPLVGIRQAPVDSGCQVLAKLECLNAMGSIKDRVARDMIEAAERDGRLQPGALILENS